MLARLRKSVSLAPTAEAPVADGASSPTGATPTDAQRAALQKAIEASTAPTDDAANAAFADARALDRFLVARDCDVAKAARQLEATLRWRAGFPVGPLSVPAGGRADASDEGAVLRAQAGSGKMAVLPTADGRGRSTILMRSGLENSSDNRGKMQYLVYTLERASRLADIGGAGQYVVLNDYTVGATSLSTMPSVAVMRETTAILQGHYPERLACMVFIGAPRVFHGLFKMIRPLIDAKTRGKLHFVDAPEQVAALDALDRAALPRSYGGDVDWEFDVERYFNEDAQAIVAQQ